MTDIRVTTIREPRDELRPLALYQDVYDHTPRPFAAPSTDDSETWSSWRYALKGRLRERLGMPAEQASPPVARQGPVTQHDGYRREYVEIETEPGVVMPAWALVPNGMDGPGPAVIAVHGHGYGVDDIVGINADGTDRSEPVGYHNDFGVELCRRGFVVLAPEMLAFGRRREAKEMAGEPGQASCYDAALWGMMLSRSLVGRRVSDTLRAIDYLQERPEVDPERIGIMGISGGGMVTLFAAALDERLQAAVISGYLCTFQGSIMSVYHCLCNYVPGLLQDAEMYDIAALLAPRPLLIEAGGQDPIFPIDAVKEAHAHVQQAYMRLQATDRFDADFFEGDHRISGAKAYDFLWGQLNQA